MTLQETYDALVKQGETWETIAAQMLWAGKRIEARLAAAAERRRHYEKVNPLGGPAKLFEAIASRIRAGDDYHETLRDFGIEHVKKKA